VLRTGSTNQVERRAFEHKPGLIECFTKKYTVTRLVHVEEFNRSQRWSRANDSSKDGPGAATSPEFTPKTPR
jgi:predicted GIY-YIG superfamily endonuclease